MIRHTAVFRLKHAAGSAAETAFLAAVRALKTIPNAPVHQANAIWKGVTAPKGVKRVEVTP
jgi:hypothetical protein